MVWWLWYEKPFLIEQKKKDLLGWDELLISWETMILSSLPGGEVWKVTILSVDEEEEWCEMTKVIGEET